MACAIAGLLLAGTSRAAEPGDVSPEVLRFLEAWAASWESQDLEDYLDHYAADAEVSGRSGETFREHKREVFDRADVVRVHLGDVSARAEGGLVSVVFDQRYTSSTLSDFGEKTLLLRPVGGSFEIVRETWQATPSGSIRRSVAEMLDGDADATRTEQAPDAGPTGAPDTGPAEAEDPPRVATDWRVSESSPGEGLEPLLGDGYRAPVSEEATPPPPVDPDALRFEPLLPRTSAPPASIAGLPEGDGEARIVEEIVATVNGRVLTRSMLVDRVEMHQEQLLLEQPPDLGQRLVHLVRETLETTIDRWLVLQEVRERRADVEAVWRHWLDAFREQVGAESLAEVRELLEEGGQDLDTLREQVIEQEVPAIFLQQEIAERIDDSEEAVRRWFDEHRERYRLPQRVTLRQIFVPVEEGTDPARAEQVALEAIQQLAAGRDWCSVEELYGVGGGPCGSVGTVALDDLLPELREPAAGLPVEAVSRPVRSGLGFHVVQVTERQGDEEAAFEEVATRARVDMLQETYEQRLADFLDQLRDAALIEINPRYEPEGARVDVPVGQ